MSAAMNLDELLRGHKEKAQSPPDGEGQAKKKGRVGTMADDADDELAKVEGALKAKDLQQAVSILLKMACMHAQMLRDLAASEWISVVAPVECPPIVASRAAGKKHAEVTAIQELKTKVGPPHLYIAQAAFKSLSEDDKVRTLLEPHQVLKAFYEQFISKAATDELGLVIRHFRVRKCYNEKFVRLQFSIAEGFQIGMGENQPAVTKLSLEQATIKALVHLDGRLKLGTAPVGHLELMAQKLLDRSKPKGGKSRGSAD
jgi:hypothetical protein